ncbi:hypothetical protein HMPREF0645_1277 [Hallella bergensis DSM 17361]|uniref:Uncharacterized protein n=1 Tax=Hallella bergensis DSM 17361 TaxID=585502 RepID=D1PWE2_9BACT|nr:hypothetical protein [Hallella bergensis]EFA44273.1 hypothetical protein HMPREF0645_1277 [Hallella bergensis DSM 17361]
MKKHLNPLEKEFLIRQYFNNPDVSLKSFCEANNVSTSPSFPEVSIVFS